MASPFRPRRAKTPELEPFRNCLADYAHNLLRSTNVSTLAAEGGSRDCKLLLEVARPKRTRLPDVSELSRERTRKLLVRYASAPVQPPRQPGAPGPTVTRNLDLCVRLFELDSTERAVLQFLLAMRSSRELRGVMEHFQDVNVSVASYVLAAAIGVRTSLVRKALGSHGRLIESGLVSLHRECNYDFYDKFEISDQLVDMIGAARLTERQLLLSFLKPAGKATLNSSDYEHIAEETRTAREILAGAIAQKRSGVNVLLYGPTGAGKTELAQLLATELGCELFGVSAADDDGDSADAHSRLRSLLVGQRLLGKTRSLLLFDEMEDLFTVRAMSSARDGKMSKQWFNLCLERNPVPTIWISNDVGGIDRAFLRRFMYAIEFQPLGIKQRARVIERQVGPHSSITASEIESIATQFATNAGVFANAVSAARLIAAPAEPEHGQIVRVLAPIAKLVDGESPRKPALDLSRYRVDALQSSEDLTRIVDRLERWQPGRDAGVSLCLYGPSGTGKSAYVHHLAHRLKRPILQKRPSDLLGPFVGQTEQALAQAFRQAKLDGAVLLFDEADSFLRDRRHAVHSWEITEVNEFLQQLESFDGIVACTTNLEDELDQAAARRFTFNVEFRYMLLDQAVSLFEELFANGIARDWQVGSRAQVRAALTPMSNLAPGDFAVVARRARALGIDRVAELIEALIDVASAKRGRRRRLGFGVDAEASRNRSQGVS